ncbi:UDP-glucose--hexose-1-phosphate uridylyltransferase [Virgibacillus sp. DJP39]|uniref:UDP-glucose--hexose-1-phosphate uridylyltransferase n=1 Tax=Virgibacillus sp. DJP39 TaxID=3409790 RepID=UPI003BB5A7E0
MDIYSIVSQLIAKGLEKKLIEQGDVIYVRNQVIGLLQLNDFKDAEPVKTELSIPDLLELIVDFAVSKDVIDDVLDEKDILSAKIMNCFLSKPSLINEQFNLLYQKSPKSATDYFYELSKNSNYIQMKRLSNNIHFKSETEYGVLDITINLSKPEKDPQQLKREREIKQPISYPTCLLCRENEGYVGRTGHPSRSNHRIIGVPLQGENWYLQYSPYMYYNEHSILFAKEHRDMKLDRGTFDRLTAFVAKFPHYFMGSNADLPIVGGSILSHDHYQGGRYGFAMVHAREAFAFSLNDFKQVRASVIRWPMSVIRLKGENRTEVVDAATHILKHWQTYSDESVEIKAFSNETPHNTITPIARFIDEKMEIDLVLRNNRTTKQHPFGIFHPHQDVHHIKKENIGLIEVMGLAVLPARLMGELKEIKSFILGETTTVTDYHMEWAQYLKIKYRSTATYKNIDSILHDEVGKKFTRVLEDAGVFKQTPDGQKAFRKFINTLNEKE